MTGSQAVKEVNIYREGESWRESCRKWACQWRAQPLRADHVIAPPPRASPHRCRRPAPPAFHQTFNRPRIARHVFMGLCKLHHLAWPSYFGRPSLTDNQNSIDTGDDGHKCWAFNRYLRLLLKRVDRTVKIALWRTALSIWTFRITVLKLFYPKGKNLCLFWKPRTFQSRNVSGDGFWNIIRRLCIIF